MEEKNKGSNIGVIIITAIVAVAITLGAVYLLFLREPKKLVNNQNNNQTSENTNADIYGTYYNSDYIDENFKIDNDNTCTFVSACGDSVTKTVPYKVTRENGKVILAIDINEDGTYPDTYTGTKNNGVYRFKPNSYGCTTDENTYFNKK